MAAIDLQEITSWLLHRITARNSLIGEAFVFGSFACGAEDPSDCDLAIVSAYSHSTLEWEELRVAIAIWVDSFESEFGIPLSVLLLTQRERAEFDEMLACGAAVKHPLL